jgi:hypothetical protein
MSVLQMRLCSITSHAKFGCNQILSLQWISSSSKWNWLRVLWAGQLMILLIHRQQMCRILLSTLKETCGYGVLIVHYYLDFKELDTYVQNVVFHCAQLAMERLKTTVSPKPTNSNMCADSWAQSTKKCRDEHQTKIKPKRSWLYNTNERRFLSCMHWKWFTTDRFPTPTVSMFVFVIMVAATLL